MEHAPFSVHVIYTILDVIIHRIRCNCKANKAYIYTELSVSYTLYTLSGAITHLIRCTFSHDLLYNAPYKMQKMHRIKRKFTPYSACHYYSRLDAKLHFIRCQKYYKLGVNEIFHLNILTAGRKIRCQASELFISFGLFSWRRLRGCWWGTPLYLL